MPRRAYVARVRHARWQRLHAGAAAGRTCTAAAPACMHGGSGVRARRQRSAHIRRVAGSSVEHAPPCICRTCATCAVAAPARGRSSGAHAYGVRHVRRQVAALCTPHRVLATCGGEPARGATCAVAAPARVCSSGAHSYGVRHVRGRVAVLRTPRRVRATHGATCAAAAPARVRPARVRCAARAAAGSSTAHARRVSVTGGGEPAHEHCASGTCMARAAAPVCMRWPRPVCRLRAFGGGAEAAWGGPGISDRLVM
ncbi:hypothetical protein GGX14DRAFT_400858 [Mycena pura]|uniref:Uncharacterized protein n=1 Tax=Mycena pura TaxID=153505 RepID=A0AAD6V1C9_9AGAR|nr:hypothetical protein GGX14DRAFT_400858 [Mycena pura]